MIEVIVISGVVAQLLGGSIYFRETLHGRNRPNRVSYFLWGLAPMIGAAAGFSAGVQLAVIPVFMAGFTGFLVFFGSFFNKKAYWKLTAFDYICGLFSLLALLLWGLTHEPTIAILFALLSDTFAALPTIKKSWTHPDSETGVAYFFSGYSAITGLVAVQALTFSEVAFPLYLLVMNLTILTALYRRRFVRR